MIEPPEPCSTMALPTAEASSAGARRLTSMVASNSAGSVSMAGCGCEIPALLTRMSKPPNAPTPRSARRAGPSGCARSTAAVLMSTPNSSASALRAADSSASSRPLSTSAAPAAANVLAMSAPIPFVAPVISALLPSRRMPVISGGPFCDGRTGENVHRRRGVGDEGVEVAAASGRDDGFHLVLADRHSHGHRNVAKGLEFHGDQPVAPLEADRLTVSVEEPRAHIADGGPQ